MGKKMPIICLVAVFILSTGIYFLFFHNIITADFAKNISVRFVYGDSNIELTVTDTADIDELKKILKGRTYRDSPSCGFSDDISITMADEKRNITFCPACDGDPIIRINDSDRYVYISEERREQLDRILEKYGMSFPCL